MTEKTAEAPSDNGTEAGETPGHAPARQLLRTRWYSVSETASLLGVSEVAVRKRIAAGTLTAMRSGRNWRVLLAGDPPPSPRPPEPVPPSEEAHSHEIQVLAQTSESLVTLVRDLQRQGLALAGQIGYLQNQLVQAQDEVKRLTEEQQVQMSVDAPASDATVPVKEYDLALREIEELRRTVSSLQQQVVEATRKRRRWFRRG